MIRPDHQPMAYGTLDNINAGGFTRSILLAKAVTRSSN